MTTPYVEYTYADGSANTTRLESVTYPDGRVVTYDYGSANSDADLLSRMAAIKD